MIRPELLTSKDDYEPIGTVSLSQVQEGGITVATLADLLGQCARVEDTCGLFRHKPTGRTLAMVMIHWRGPESAMPWLVREMDAVPQDKIVEGRHVLEYGTGVIQ